MSQVAICYLSAMLSSISLFSATPRLMTPSGFRSESYPFIWQRCHPAYKKFGLSDNTSARFDIMMKMMNNILSSILSSKIYKIPYR